MGQIVAALMVGIQTAKIPLTTEDGENRWDVPLGPHYGGLHPRWSEDGDVLGFTFYEREIPTVAVAGIEQAFAGEIAEARGRWADFAAWMLRECGVALPDAQVLLTSVEVS